MHHKIKGKGRNSPFISEWYCSNLRKTQRKLKYRIFSIKRQTPNKRGVYRAEFKINTPDVYSGSRRLFKMIILNHEFAETAY